MIEERGIVLKNVRNSTVTINNMSQSSVERLIREFDLANATPIVCQDFIRQLKQLSK